MNYAVVNAFYHLAHLSIVFFVALGWAWAPARPWHAAFVLVTLASWVLAKRQKKKDACVVTVWHWNHKEGHGLARPKGPYVHYMLQKLLRRELPPQATDKGVVLFTLCVALLSIFLNVQNFLKP